LPVTKLRKIITTAAAAAITITIIIIIITINCDKVNETVGHTIAVCLSLSESKYLGRHSQLAKIIHQQCAIEYKLFDRNTLPYCRYRPEGVLE
jgi:predicted hydrocarbon binding protein